MSIILKGIDLPNSGEIELIIRPHGKVLSNTRGIYAEAIQIPKGHGRIIDESDLIRELTELNDLNLENIASTILESEEEE